MIIWDGEQGSDAWVKEKLGKPSASNASKILTNSGEPSKQREGYLHELVAERITGESEDKYKNNIMEMGNEREEESRKLYEITYDVEVTKVGLIYKDEQKKFLCSPDGLIVNKDSQYGLEMKNVLGKTQVGYLRKNELPSDYFSQVQFSLYVTEFEFWDFWSYRPSMKPLFVRVQRDEKFISRLSVELEVLCKQIDEITEKIK